MLVQRLCPKIRTDIVKLTNAGCSIIISVTESAIYSFFFHLLVGTACAKYKEENKGEAQMMIRKYSGRFIQRHNSAEFKVIKDHSECFTKQKEVLKSPDG